MVERDSGFVCVRVCVCSAFSQRGGAQKSIKCVKRDVIRWATYPSFLAFCSIPAIRDTVYQRKRKKLIPEPVYVGLAVACKTLP